MLTINKIYSEIYYILYFLVEMRRNIFFKRPVVPAVVHQPAEESSSEEDFVMPVPDYIPAFPAGVRILAMIGSGASGDVYKVVEQDGREAAYKLFGGNDMENMDRTLNLKFVREAGIYKHLGNRNPGLCKVREIGEGYISMCLAKGDLSSDMGEFRKRKLNENGVRQSRVLNLKSSLEDIATLIATLDLLHKENVGHFDIKPENILRTTGGKLRICDFGSASVIPDIHIRNFEHVKDMFKSGKRVLIQDLSYMNTAVTRQYAAPELYLSTSETGQLPMYPAADIWSLGMVIFQILTGYNLYNIRIRHGIQDGVSVYEGAYIDSVSGFMNLYTDDIERGGFVVYYKDQRELEEALSAASKSARSNKISPYALLLKEQSEESLFFGEGEKEDIRLVWDLIKRMLDPNPLTRITASECLESKLFTKHSYINNLIKEFYLEHERRSSVDKGAMMPRYLGSSRVSRSLANVTSLYAAYPRRYAFLERDKVLAGRMERMLNVVYYKMEDVLENIAGLGRDVTERKFREKKELIQFCTMVLAFYAERRSIAGTKAFSKITSAGPYFDLPPDLEIRHMMEDDTFLQNIGDWFLSMYRGDLPSLRKAVFTLTYFLLVEVFEFDLWI